MLGLRPTRAVVLGTLSGLLGFLALGCGGDKGNRVSGKVTYKGQPVPAGRIYFMPDTKKGNKGPTGFAEIKNGAYDTAEPGGHGAVAGAMIVKIEGYDPNQKDKTDAAGETPIKPLFPTYQTAAELPKEDTTKDFDVPATAGGKQPGPGQPGTPGGTPEP